MTAHARGRRPARPQIYLTPADHEALERLVGDLPGTGAVGLLQQELDRAVIRKGGAAGKPAVGLNQWVEYVDDHSDRVRRVQVVPPADADIDQGRVSVLSFVGAGLIGMTEGQAIDWTDPSGERRRLTVLKIGA